MAQFYAFQGSFSSSVSFTFIACLSNTHFDLKSVRELVRLLVVCEMKKKENNTSVENQF